MFDIGFTELLLISIVALLVLGPERLPQAVRTAALWLGRARRSFNKVKTEIEQQLNTDEIRRQLHNESILQDLEEAKNKANEALRDTEKSITALGDEIQSGAESESRKSETLPAATQAEARDEQTATDNSGTQTNAQEKPQNELQKESQEDSPAAAASPATEPDKPAHDFYNNPPGGMVSMKGGQFSVANTDTEETPGESKPAPDAGAAAAAKPADKANNNE